jgi:hypothetical protein
MNLRKVRPEEKHIRTALLSDLKEKLGGWRKDATGKQVAKMRIADGGKVPERRGEPEGKMQHPVPFAEGGVVESDEEGTDESEPVKAGSDQSVDEQADLAEQEADEAEGVAGDEEDDEDKASRSRSSESLSDMIRELSRGQKNK